jgi:DNA topoisomerase-3
MRQAAAVEARIALDLRIGAAFTRLQTMGLQNRIPELADKVMSYGRLPSIDLPALTRQDRASSQPSASSSTSTNACRPLSLNLSGSSLSLKSATKAKSCFAGEGTICSISRSPSSSTRSASRTLWQLSQTSKPSRRLNGALSLVIAPADTDRKPLPLTTVDLQQSGSRLLRLTPKQVLDVS